MLNPNTLEQETEEQRKLRERITGVYGDGTTVKCFPTDDPMVSNTVHRAVCITKPYNNCQGCSHSSFTLFYDPNLIALKIKAKHEFVKCPQWNSTEERLQGLSPEYYMNVQRATCEIARPFPFCAQCPSYKNLEDSGIDKKKEWYTRWKKYG